MAISLVLPSDRLDKMIFSIGIFMHCIGLILILSNLYIQYRQVEVDGFVAYYNSFNRMLEAELSSLEERQDSLAPAYENLIAEFPSFYIHLSSLPDDDVFLASQEYMSTLLDAKSELERQSETLSLVKGMNNQQMINTCEIARYYAEQQSLSGIHSRLQPLAWVFSVLGIAMYVTGYIGWSRWEKKSELSTRLHSKMPPYKITHPSPRIRRK